MKFKLFIFAIIIIMASGVYASIDLTPTSISPTNNSATVNSYLDLTFWTKFLEYNGSQAVDCQVTSNMTSNNGMYKINYTFNSVSNNTRYVYSIRELNDSSYRWTVNCSNSSNGGSSSKIFENVQIESIPPVFTWNYPNNATISNYNGIFGVNATVIEINPSNCSVWSNANITNKTINGGGVFTNQGGVNYNNSMPFGWNFTAGMNDGDYVVYMICNETLNIPVTSPIRTFNVRRTGATPTGCIGPVNNSIGTSRRTLYWAPVTSKNFGYYYLSVNNNGTVSNYKISNNNTNSATVDFIADGNSSWYVTSYDQYGNSNSSTNCSATSPFILRTTSACSNMVSGWNACGWISDTQINLSAYSNLLGSGIIVSSWNYTNNMFISYLGVADGSNGNYIVQRGYPVWAYMSSAAISNIDFTYNTTPVSMTLLNNSGNASVPLAMTSMNATMMNTISDAVNSSCSSMQSLTYVTGTRYYNYFCGTNDNANITVRPASLLWFEWNATKVSGINVTR